MGIVFKNNAKTTLASSLSNSATSATVTDGSVFPSLSAGEFFLLTFDDGTNNEICKCTARSGNTLTIVRAQESTTARAFSSGDAAEGRVTAGVLETIQENIAAKSANQTVYNTTTASSATDYDIGIDPSVEANAMVFLNGVMQHHDTFSFSGSTLTFDAAPPDGMALEVIVDNLINLQSSNLTVDTFTAADVSGNPQTDFVLSDTPAAETNLIVFIDGVFQDQDAYTISNNTLTITDGVTADFGVTVYVINPVNIGTPSDGTVTSAKLSGNITMPGTLTVGSNDVAFDSPTFVVDNANSRVGLGTASPSVPVDIVGDVKMSANLTVDTSTLHVDSTNNRVGIGTDSPDEPLHIFSTTDADILLEGTEAGTSTRFAKVAFANNISGTTTDLGAITANTDGATNSSSFKFFTANAGSVTNKMTITSGDAVLVGKDSDAFATAGVVLATSQNSAFTRNSGNVLALRRNTNDGDLVTLYKDTAKIGSIASRGGTTASFITNTASGSGAGISGSTNMVIACDETGAANGSTVSLGSTSTQWKDLYLSGTANIAKTRLTTNNTTYWDIRRDSSTGHFVISDDGLGDVVTIKQDSGNVGIGVTSPNNKLEVDGHIGYSKGTNSNRYLLVEGGDGTWAGTVNIQAGFGSTAAGGAIKLYGHSHGTYPGSVWIGRSSSAAGDIMFGNGGTGPLSSSNIQMVIDSSGNVGIGTTSPNANAKLHVQDSDGSYPDDTNNHLVVESASHSYIGLGGGTSSDVGIHMGDSGGIGRGKLAYLNASDAMVLYTSGTERVRIDSSGRWMCGVTSPIDLGQTSVEFDGTTQNGVVYRTTRSATGSTFVKFRNSSNQTIGYIYQDGSTTVNYFTNSDYRLKENVVYDWTALARLNQLKPARYNFIGDDNTVDGFIAHELQAVMPEVVIGDKDAVKEEDGVEVPDYQGVAVSKLVPLLVKSVQELSAKVDTLEAEIEVLRNG